MIDDLEQLAVGYAQFDEEQETDQSPSLKGAPPAGSKLRRLALKLAIVCAIGFAICATGSTLFLS